MQKRIPSAVFQNMSGDFFVFNYRHGVDGCVYSNKEHDHIGWDAFVKTTASAPRVTLRSASAKAAQNW
jgi:hypothetical protein